MRRRNIFEDSKLTFKSKKFWKIMLVPSLVITFIVSLPYLLTGNIAIFIKDYNAIKLFLALCFFIGIFACVIEGYWIEYKKFKKEDKKGKFICITIFLMILMKEIFEILRSRH